jgi:HEAT repeat protein
VTYWSHVKARVATIDRRVHTPGVSGQSVWGLTPRQSIEAECARRGKAAVVAGCVDLLAGRDADPDLVIALGGPGAARVVSGENKQYWLRVWGARGLLWTWDDSAVASVTAALGDDHWRVREMACKVIARHHVGDALPALAELRDDPVSRVRAAASRAVVLLTDARA